MAPLQTARESFDLKQLSSDLERNRALPRPFTVQCLVARTAGDQGLPLARSHLLDPGRNRPTAMTLEILQVAHVVDLHAVA